MDMMNLISDYRQVMQMENAKKNLAVEFAVGTRAWFPCRPRALR